MKIITFIVVLFFCCQTLFSQKVTPFIDFNNYFENFHKGTFNIVDLQLAKEFKAGDDCVAYMDFRDNLVVFDGETKKNLANFKVNYQVSDHLIGWRIGQTINMWDNGELRTLTYNGDTNYVVKDSIIVFADLRYNSMKVYWNHDVYTLYSVVDDLYKPAFIGENIVAFKDNGNFYKVFWNGKIYDIGIWNNDIVFNGGTDVLAFNDPTTRTFTVFDQGEFVEVESFYMNNYKAGRGFVVYEDLNNNLNLYKNGEKNKISNFSSSKWEVKDEVILWVENNFLKTFYKNEAKSICNFVPQSYLLKNNVIAYRNVMGGVNAFIDGVNYEITNQQESDFEIYGSSVLVEMFNKSFVVLHNGTKFSK
jgi:hypothetical protein